MAVGPDAWSARYAVYYGGTARDAERPAEGWAVAGAEAVLTLTAEGPGRFAECQQFIDDVLERSIAVGEVTRPFGGPHFFGAFAFFNEVEPGEPFPSVRLFVPRWQVSRARDRTIAVANLLIEPGAELDALAGKVWRAHGKFRAFDYSAPDFSERPAASGDGPSAMAEAGGEGSYRRAVARAVGMIEEGRFDKIVLARCQELTAPGVPFNCGTDNAVVRAARLKYNRVFKKLLPEIHRARKETS